MPLPLPRPGPADYLPIFHDEIALVPEAADFPTLLRVQIEETRALADRFGESGAALRYAPGKWSVRQILGHLSDCERILSYRLLRFLRADPTVLSGFDHNAYVPAAAFERRPMESVVEELQAVRSATIALIEGSAPQRFSHHGQVGSSTITAAALAYLIAGHERHHQEVLRTRYLPLLESD
jgi:hypothetical protein